MAVVVVMVGQCGNQLGDELFAQLNALRQTPSSSSTSASAPLSSSSPDRRFSPFFAADGKARCVLVDSEPKVVEGVFSRHPDLFRRDNVVSGQSGRGNNWGLGYYGVNDPHSRRHEEYKAAFRNMRRGQREVDDTLLSRALRAIHRETRRTSDCPSFDGILVLHSLAGGTGSGLASRLAERIRIHFVQPRADGGAGATVSEAAEYAAMREDGLDDVGVEKRRAKMLVTVTVAPQSAGELSTQSLNAALTLHALHHCVDAALVLRNDDAFSPGGPATGASSSSSGSSVGGSSLLRRCTTFKEANEVLVALLLPILRYGQPQRTGCLTSLVWQCAPPSAAGRRATGSNVFLTVLPTPQRTYARFRHACNRGLFFALYGGKDFMPGCEPAVPADVLLSTTALRQAGGEDGGGDGDRHGDDAETAHYGGAGMMARDSRTAVRGGSSAVSARRGGGRGAAKRPRMRGEEAFGLYSDEQEEKPEWRGAFDDSDEESHTESKGRRNDEENQESYNANDPLRTVKLSVPPPLMKYYRSLKKAPVKDLCGELEGVLVLNQVRELNVGLTFPLLKSAALKVHVGAFLAPYSDVGVSAERIQRAYRDMAFIFSAADKL